MQIVGFLIVTAYRSEHGRRVNNNTSGLAGARLHMVFDNPGDVFQYAVDDLILPFKQQTSHAEY